MASEELRPGEVAVDAAVTVDQNVQFIGSIRTPFSTRSECPRQGDTENGPICRLEILPHWQPALKGLERFEAADVLYWLHTARRDLVLQSPKSDGRVIGTFALRSPVRPNPIGLSRVAVLGVDGGAVLVRGLDCLDGTPLLDLKPEHCPFTDLPKNTPVKP
ncbi:MAG: tRNA (N6-threonylcarbamoyladenosine(37)-N6)-methyltransferase TrmO [Paracoccaceae bacterium]